MRPIILAVVLCINLVVLCAYIVLVIILTVIFGVCMRLRVSVFLERKPVINLGPES